MGLLNRRSVIFIALVLIIVLYKFYDKRVFLFVGSIYGAQQILMGAKKSNWSAIIETPLGNKTYAQIEEEIFLPLGYKIREKTLIPSLDFIQPLNCPKVSLSSFLICFQVFSDWLTHSYDQDESAKPPRDIPSALLDDYTLNGNVHLIQDYMDDRSGTKRAIWMKEGIDRMIRGPVSKESTSYGGAGLGIYNAMKAFNVSGKNGVVIGSLSPWVEAHALKLGAAHVTTVEYMHITIPDDDRIDYLHPIDIAKNMKPHLGAYDFVASFSSIEHSGLGRFGDALDPIGDLREAMKIHCMLKDDGLLFIAFPIGWDTMYWNLHRIYGRIRFALFSAGFDILGMYYINGEIPITEEMLAKPKKIGTHTQTTIVLRKRRNDIIW